MTTRISTGITVQAISSPVWWLVWLGTGFRFSLKRMQTQMINPATNTVMTVMITSTMK